MAEREGRKGTPANQQNREQAAGGLGADGPRLGPHLTMESPPGISSAGAGRVRNALRQTLRLHRRPETIEQSELVARARTGDPDAFSELVKESSEDVYRLALRITGNNEDAEDIAQEAYIKAHQGIKRFRGDSQFSTWMYRITANTALTSFRLGRGKSDYDEIPEDQIPDEYAESDPEKMFEAGVFRDQVVAALKDLSPLQRSVIILRDVYELPHSEIAAALEITNSASKKRLFDARQKLHKILFPLQNVEEAQPEDD